jgi:hypothetical protein
MPTSRAVRRLKWADDPLVPINGGRLREAIAYWGRSHRELAKALSRPRRPVPPQTLDALCAGAQRRCRASLRQALAEELGVLDGWLASATDYPGLTLDNMLQERRAVGPASLWKVPMAWYQLLLSLELEPAVHAALVDLPGAIGHASLAMGLLTMDKTGLLHIDSRLLRADLRELEAWYAWLQGWIELEGREKVRAALTRALPHLRTRFVQVNRYLGKPSSRRAKMKR